MAEGLSNTFQSGSDADVEVSCTPCEEDGSIKRATNYCPTCDQHFCTACLKYHARFPATKTHIVTDIHSTGQQVLKVTRAIPDAKCIVHPDRNIELYCGQHNMVFCALCVAMNHRTCTGVIEVTNAITPKMNQSELQSLIGTVDDLETQFQESKKRKERNIQQLESREIKLKEEIENEYRLLMQHIDKLRESALTCLKETSEQVIAQIKKEIREATEMEKTLQKSRSHVSSSDTSSNSQTFIQQVLVQNNVRTAQHLLSSLNSYESKHIEVDINTSLHEFVLTSTNIAQSKEIAQSKGIAQSKENTVRFGTGSSTFGSGTSDIGTGSSLLENASNLATTQTGFLFSSCHPPLPLQYNYPKNTNYPF